MRLPRQCIPFYLCTPSDHNSAFTLVIAEIRVEAEARVSINFRRRFWAVEGNPEVRLEKPTHQGQVSPERGSDFRDSQRLGSNPLGPPGQLQVESLKT
jgi:hypothetical protein